MRYTVRHCTVSLYSTEVRDTELGSSISLLYGESDMSKEEEPAVPYGDVETQEAEQVMMSGPWIRMRDKGKQTRENGTQPNREQRGTRYEVRERRETKSQSKLR